LHRWAPMDPCVFLTSVGKSHVHVSSSSYDMYPPPRMTCILLLIWHVRLFDLRSLEHSTIIYESAPPPDSAPLLRLAWNKQVFIHTHNTQHTNTHTHTHTHMFKYIYIYTHTHKHTHTHTHTQHTHTHKYICLNMYIYIHTHIGHQLFGNICHGQQFPRHSRRQGTIHSGGRVTRTWPGLFWHILNLFWHILGLFWHMPSIPVAGLHGHDQV
jgi:hypothetical protein